jgi:hypothetical protein
MDIIDGIWVKAIWCPECRTNEVQFNTDYPAIEANNEDRWSIDGGLLVNKHCAVCKHKTEHVLTLTPDGCLRVSDDVYL